MEHVTWIDIPSLTILYLDPSPTRNTDLDSKTDVKSPQKIQNESIQLVP